MSEFIFSLGLATVTLAGTGFLFKAEWNRAKCAYLVFESTHAKLMGMPENVSMQVRIDENENSVEGNAQCGSAKEKVRLKKIH